MLHMCRVFLLLWSDVMARDARGRIPFDKTDRAVEDVASSAEAPFLRRMNDPSAFVRSACGDEMEFDLDIRDGAIREARY